MSFLHLPILRIFIKTFLAPYDVNYEVNVDSVDCARIFE